jgi:CRISPR-associated protein Cmr3
LYLLQKDIEVIRLRIETGQPDQNTSLGKVRLPRIPTGGQGSKPFDKAWLCRSDWQKILAGGLPNLKNIFEPKDLYMEESRLGIARDNDKRTVKKGLLYQSCHIRPRQSAQLFIEADITGLGDFLADKRIVRFGGEGRLAGIEAVKPPPFLEHPVPESNTCGLVLTLLAAARFRNNSWLPEGFSETEIDGVREWKGEINDVPLTICSAVIGKALREGGWDMAEHKPRTMRSLVPPGSAWYCRIDGNDFDRAIQALHGRQIGEDQELGRGRIACGLWNIDTEILNKKGENHDAS